MTRSIALPIAVAVAACFCATVSADAAPQPYVGKTIDITVSSDTGGGYDTYSRLLARHLAQHVPGNPTIVVQNMPGGGGIRATNYLYNVAPKDGSVIALIDRGMATAPLLYGAESKAQFEAVKFTWLGSVMQESGMGVVSSRVPVHNLEEAKHTDLVFGSTGPEADTSMYARLTNELLGTHVRVINGYSGQPEIFQAIEKGELQGLFMSGWSGNGRAYVRDQMAKGKMRLLVQMADEGDPAHADTPTIRHLVTKPEDQQIVDLILARLSLGRPFVAPPGVPADRAELLRTAFRSAIDDPALRAEADRLKLAINPIFGAEAQKVVERLYATPSAIVERTRAIVRVSGH
jgi:tripartite-type tricarboxylate transporter receptor subunit TctC